MSHKDYIKDFDTFQLKALREIINERLDTLLQEEKKLLWVVVDKYLCHKYFKQENYTQAVEYLSKTANSLASESKDYRVDKDELSLSIETRLVPTSEVDSYLELF